MWITDAEQYFHLPVLPHVVLVGTDRLAVRDPDLDGAQAPVLRSPTRFHLHVLRSNLMGKYHMTISFPLGPFSFELSQTGGYGCQLEALDANWRL